MFVSFITASPDSTDVSINTAAKLLVGAGTTCAAFHDENVRDMKARCIQCDEIWTFTDAKPKSLSTKTVPEVAGNIWTWAALESETKRGAENSN